MSIFRLSTRFPTELLPALNQSTSKQPPYQDAARLTGRLQKYVNEVSEFVGGQMGKDVVEFFDIKARALSLAVPRGMTATQREAINAVRSWARMKNHNPVEGSIREF
jgi:hypothetical protein